MVGYLRLVQETGIYSSEELKNFFLIAEKRILLQEPSDNASGNNINTTITITSLSDDSDSV